MIQSVDTGQCLEEWASFYKNVYGFPAFDASNLGIPTKLRQDTHAIVIHPDFEESMIGSGYGKLGINFVDSVPWYQLQHDRYPRARPYAVLFTARLPTHAEISDIRNNVAGVKTVDLPEGILFDQKYAFDRLEGRPGATTPRKYSPFHINKLFAREGSNGKWYNLADPESLQQAVKKHNIVRPPDNEYFPCIDFYSSRIDVGWITQLDRRPSERHATLCVPGNAIISNNILEIVE